MSKSNHQKHGFKPNPKFMRKFGKDFTTFPKLAKHLKWNGDSLTSVFNHGEVGTVENIRWVE